MTARPLRGDERAVSTVLGAVLMFGLLILTLVMIQVRFVPVWTEEREAKHMADLTDQLAFLKADLDRQAGNATGPGLTDPLTLETSGGFEFFQGATAGAEVTFAPSTGGQGVQVTSPNLRMQIRGGVPLFGLDEDWIAITTGDTVRNVTGVHHLRMRIDMIPSDYVDGDSATLTITDGNGAFAGKAVIIFRDFPSEQALELQTYGPDNTQISSSIEAFFQQTVVDWMYFDLLEPGLLFRDVLGAARLPLTLSLAQNGLIGDYTIVYSSTSGGLVSSGGINIPNFSQTLGSGSLVVAANNQHYVPQNYTLEHGAVILEQRDGEVLVLPPTLSVRATSNLLALEWTLPALVGASGGLDGVRAASVTIQPEAGGADFVGAAPRLTFRIPTEHPAVWAQFLRGRMAEAGLSETGSNPGFLLNVTATDVLLDIRGPRAATTDMAEDIALRFIQTPISVELRPAG